MNRTGLGSVGFSAAFQTRIWFWTGLPEPGLSVEVFLVLISFKLGFKADLSCFTEPLRLDLEFPGLGSGPVWVFFRTFV